MAYATYEDVQARTSSEIDEALCETLLEDAAVIIDSYNQNASEDAKKVVSCKMVIRAIGNSSVDVPIGATQGSMSALGYSQSWTLSSGSTGELYVSKLEKKLLGVGNQIGSYSPVQELVEGSND
ncbi:MAG: hypothetical protein IIY21_23545 [Clostridiales bacterium]|jgi:hypothetical protein|nr:hypothetical protein [Clostridiales bacterium]